MLLILGIIMKALEYSKQTKFNKITTLLVAVQTYRIVGVVFLLGLTQGIFEPAFAIPAGVGDILVGWAAIPRRHFSMERIQLVKVRCCDLVCVRYY